MLLFPLENHTISLNTPPRDKFLAMVFYWCPYKIFINHYEGNLAIFFQDI